MHENGKPFAHTMETFAFTFGVKSSSLKPNPTTRKLEAD